MVASFYVKDPDDTLDYDVDWTAWLAGDTIATSTWVADDGIIAGTPPSSFTTTHTKVWLSGGDLHGEFNIVNHITTAQGRVKDQEITVLIEQQ